MNKDFSKEWENFFKAAREPEKAQAKQKADAPKKRGDKIDISI